MKRIDLKKELHMDFLIQQRCTGNVLAFAQKLDLSRSALFNCLDYMRNDLGVCILYDRYGETYRYEGDGLYAALGFKETNQIPGVKPCVVE